MNFIKKFYSNKEVFLKTFKILLSLGFKITEFTRILNLNESEFKAFFNKENFFKSFQNFTVTNISKLTKSC